MGTNAMKVPIRWADYGPVLTPREVAEILSISRSTLLVMEATTVSSSGAGDR